MLEDAAGLREARSVFARGNAVGRDHDELAGLDIADVLGAEQVEGAGFRGEDEDVGRAVFTDDAAHGEGAEAAGSRAAKMRSRVIMTTEKAPSICESESAMASTSVVACECAMSWTMISESDGGLEEGALALEFGADVAEVDQIAVVRNGDEAFGGFDADGLRVE